MTITRRSMMMLTTAGAAAILLPEAARAQAGEPQIEVARSATCGCCGAWIEHVRSAGFVVRETVREDLDVVKAALGVPSELQSCHTATIDGFVIEGHVPAAEIQRLLEQRPPATGLAVAGMPAGSPGMEMGGIKDAYEVVLFGDAGREVFARY
jgi:hypothetical protein